MHKKKLLGSTLALALSVGQVNAAELFKDLSFGGQMDLQATSARNARDFATNAAAGGNTNNDRIGDVQTRIMLDAMWNVLDDVHAMVSVTKNDRTWGTVGGNPQAAGNSQPGITGGGTGVLNNLYVTQAHVKIDDLMGALDATLGRQYYGESGDMVVYFGPSDKALYGMPVTALDALRVDWSNDMVGVTGVAGKITGTALGGAVARDVDLEGINAALKGHENLSAAAYVYRRVTHGALALGAPANNADAGGRNDNLYIAGAKVKAMLGQAAWLGVEAAKNFGTQRQTGSATVLATRKYTGWAAKVDAGMKAEVAGVGSLTPWGHVAYGTGDSDSRSNENNGFVAISGDYRPGTINGRFANAMGVANPIALAEGVDAFSGTNPAASNGTLTNRFIYGAGVKVAPGAAQKLMIALAWWNFRTQTGAIPTVSGGARPYGGNRTIGSELDLDLTWKHSDNVSVGAGVARFWAGSVIRDAIANPAGAGAAGSGNNPVSLVYADARIKWGGK